MATIVNMHQAKASLSRLVERALAGEEVIISRNGEPLIQLVPAPKKAPAPHAPGRSEETTAASPDVELTGDEIAEA